MLSVEKCGGYWFFNQREKEWNYLQTQWIAELVLLAYMHRFFIILRANVGSRTFFFFELYINSQDEMESWISFWSSGDINFP